MNAMFFGTKRAYHGILRVTRRRLAPSGLTPARFDLLWSVMRYGERDRECVCKTQLTQSGLRRKLGVTASTVCRMLKSLEALGFVRRKVALEDRRQRIVELSNRAFAWLRSTRTTLLRAAQRLVDRALSFGQPRDRDACSGHMCVLEDYLDGMRARFGDTAARIYPWHPDD
jgi:DNA-binding MarR family transcriptional regulator